jgi:flagellar export protein FliJ
MLDQLRRTLRRRERLVRVRQLQQEQAQQALAVILREEEALHRERQTFEEAQTETHRSLLARFDDPAPIRSDDLVLFTRHMDRLSRLIRTKEREIEALQTPIRQRREEVVARYRSRRSMEILTDNTHERVVYEELKQEQGSLDEITAQRFRRNGHNGQTA